MAWRLPFREYDATLVASGFHRLGASAGSGDAIYCRPVQGRWAIEAVRGPGRGRHVDLGLTVEPGRRSLIGPVHRAPSAAALAAALPRIVASLEALAAASESLRCPDCHAWEVMQIGQGGPFLACGDAARGRRPFDRRASACRRNPALQALIVYDDRGSPR